VERNAAWLESICVMELRTVHGARMNGIAVSYKARSFCGDRIHCEGFHILMQLSARKNFIEFF